MNYFNLNGKNHNLTGHFKCRRCYEKAPLMSWMSEQVGGRGGQGGIFHGRPVKREGHGWSRITAHVRRVSVSGWSVGGVGAGDQTHSVWTIPPQATPWPTWQFFYRQSEWVAAVSSVSVVIFIVEKILTLSRSGVPKVGVEYPLGTFLNY